MSEVTQILSENVVDQHFIPTGPDLIANLPFAVYTCDKDGFITQFNECAVELWGRTPSLGIEQWCGSWKIYNRDGSPLPLNECPMAITLKTGVAVTGQEIIVEKPDGTKRLIAPYPRPLFNEKQELTGAINILQDVTDQKEKEEKLAHFAAIVESSDDAIISKTLNGVVTSWNIAAERIFGYTAEEMVGAHITKIIPPDRQDEEPKILQQLRKGIRVDHFNTTRVAKDGRLIDISLTISPVRNSKGELIGASKIARDISFQKTAEILVRNNQDRFRMAVASTGLGTWEFCPQEGKLTWSDECRKIYGIPAEGAIDFDLFARHLFPEDAEYVQKAIQQAMDPAGEGHYDVQFRIVRMDGKIRWIRSQGKVYFNTAGKAENFIGTVLDITEERSAHEALQQLVDERTKDLTELNRKLEESNQELEQFAYVASHDLQEPLRKIRAFGDMLRSKYVEQLGAEGSDLIGRMQSASDRMKDLIESLLAYSRVSNSPTEHDLLDLNHILGEVLLDLETPVRETRAQIKTEKLYPAKADPLQIRQLFQNLLSNSLKFMGPEAPPEIAVLSSVVQGAETGMVEKKDLQHTFQLIKIRDNGIGFEQEYAERIFKLFERLHGKGSYSGSGMGLSIVQKIVKNHNGYIWATGEPDKGSCFNILLPMQGTHL